MPVGGRCYLFFCCCRRCHRLCCCLILFSLAHSDAYSFSLLAFAITCIATKKNRIENIEWIALRTFISLNTDNIGFSVHFQFIWTALKERVHISTHPSTYLCSHLSGIIALVFMFIHEISRLLSLFTSLFVHSVYKISILCLWRYIHIPCWTARHSTATFHLHTYLCNTITANAANVIRFTIPKRQNTAPLSVNLESTGPEKIVSIRFELSV